MAAEPKPSGVASGKQAQAQGVEHRDHGELPDPGAVERPACPPLRLD